MTLNTVVSFGAPVDPEALFGFCRTMLFDIEAAGNEGTPLDPANVPIRRGPTYSKTHAEIGHPLGVGLPALLSVDHNGGAEPIPARNDGDEDMAEYYSKCPSHNGWSYANADFDTGYGYRHPATGIGCTALHAVLIIRLVEWASAQTPAVPVKWRNEYTGEWHDGVAGIAEFVEVDGKSASDWFRDIAQPAIEMKAAESGSTVRWL